MTMPTTDIGNPPMRPVIFLHLPKAAGSTLRTIFRKKYARRRLHHLSGNPDEADAFPSLPQEERHQIDLLTGHQHFGMHQWLRPGARYFTMLRHPVDRCISHYYFVLRRPDHYLHDRVVRQKMTLYDYVSNRTSRELDNDQVRWLNDDGHRAAGFGEVTREMLEVAKRRLADEIEVSGLAERFDESLRMIADALGWGTVEYSNVNVTANRPARETTDPRALESICEYNRFDLELYEYAAELFAARVKKGEMAA
jgi:hypothetical protein